MVLVIAKIMTKYRDRTKAKAESKSHVGSNQHVCREKLSDLSVIIGVQIIIKWSFDNKLVNQTFSFRTFYNSVPCLDTD